ncbi:hypothetical protein LCGC14_2181250 [marine sediment metagenome]|uniref:Calcineurin-like phosphoesterase domain-containing protein n=1 Tax=marine sediment metagenome TaxID=412755 RepID=A0A0F9DMD4_9ZZZZ
MNISENTPIIGDTHFSHNNIIEYTNRPFKNYEEMNNVMVHNWNQEVLAGEDVLHVGDFSFGTKRIIKEVRERLNGKIIYLIKGNHDGRSRGFFKSIGIIIIDPFRWKNIIFSHRPIRIWYLKQINLINIHGHIHYRDSPFKNQINVSVERLNYRPVRLGKILKDHGY